MKRIVFSLLIALSLVVACTKDTVTEYYTFYRPVYKTKDAVRADIKNSAVQSIQKPGKIVWKDNFVFVNDVDRGVHIIDISNPSQARTVSYISIPGSVDIAVYGNYLYADCYTDLVTMDITDPLNISVKQVMPGVFPHRFYDNGFRADTSKVIQEWIKVDTVVTRRFSEKIWYESRMDILAFSSSSFVSASQSGSAQSAGIGLAGSMARFALTLKQRMYAVSNSDLKVFNMTNAAAPSYVKTLALANSNIETVFPYQDKLFIGSQTGMFIYDAANPDQPQKLGQFTHVRSCDPVIADNGYAYVTLKGGSACGGFTNQLDVLDISNLLTPKLVKTYTLTSPAGLSKDGQLLFICDGKDGLKIFNAANPSSVSLLKQVAGFEPNDVIAQNGTAIVIASDGLHIIDYADPVNAKEISKITLATK